MHATKNLHLKQWREYFFPLRITLHGSYRYGDSSGIGASQLQGPAFYPGLLPLLSSCSHYVCMGFIQILGLSPSWGRSNTQLTVIQRLMNMTE